MNKHKNSLASLGDQLGYNPYRDTEGRFDDGPELLASRGRKKVSSSDQRKKIDQAKERLKKQYKIPDKQQDSREKVLSGPQYLEFDGFSIEERNLSDNDLRTTLWRDKELRPGETYGQYYETEKARKGDIFLMTPAQYRESLIQSGQYKNVESIESRMEWDKVEQYTEDMQSGDKFPPPTLRYDEDGKTEQEGLHRIYAAERVGITEIPVVVSSDTRNQAIYPYQSLKNDIVDNYIEPGTEDNTEQAPQPQVTGTAGAVDYRMSHTAPHRGDEISRPGNDLEEVFPDIYDGGLSYYPSGYAAEDKQMAAILAKMRDNPDAEVTMYRSVPDYVDSDDIADGDWVSLTEGYAKEHGESNLDGKYKIIKKKVKASEVYNNGDSIQEWGYSPNSEDEPKGGKTEEALQSKVVNQISARDYEDIYKDLDIDMDDLGCIMLDLEPMEVMGHLPTEKQDELYDKPLFEQGSLPAETRPHVTLLYGLLENGNKWKNKVDKLLSDWKVKTVTIEEVGFFESPDSYAVVAHLKKTDELVDGHERLTLLPHINTFSEYKPHMTLAYVELDADVNEWVKALGKVYNGKTVKAKGINYGDKPEEKDAKKKNHVEDEHNFDRCLCCNGAGEHNTGFECYGCDATGSKKAFEGTIPCEGREDSEKVWLDEDGDYRHAEERKDNSVAVSKPVLGAYGQDHNSLSPMGLILVQNALDDSSREIIRAQQNALRSGFERIERDVLAAATDNDNPTDGNPLTKSEIRDFERQVQLLLNTFYINLYPIFGRQVMKQRALEYGELGAYEMTKEAQAYITEMAEKAAESHIATVIKDIAAAVAISYAIVTAVQLAALIAAALAVGNAFVVKKFDGNPSPTREEIDKAIKDGKFDGTDLYKEAQKLANEGQGREEIVRAIQNKYPEISKNRATTIARTEAARVFNQSQFEADRQFLNSAGLMDKAYKKLRSRTGTPCVHCKLLIDKPPIPFMQNFADLGTVLSATESKEDGSVKVKQLPVNWESIKAGNVHPNCNCEYVLIVKN